MCLEYVGTIKKNADLLLSELKQRDVRIAELEKERDELIDSNVMLATRLDKHIGDALKQYVFNNGES